MKHSDKILIALQYWKGDQPQSMRLARFLADIETRHSTRADLLLVNRFDCPLDTSILADVSKKFNTFFYRSPKTGTGWPHGCNELWFATVEWCYHMIEAKKIPAYKAIFTCEGDGVPLRSNWINYFSNQWDMLQSDKRPVYIAGSLQQSPGEHINGNCFVSGNLAFLHWVAKRVGGCSAREGWDYSLAGQFKKWGWADMPGIKSEWQRRTFPQEDFMPTIREGVVWHHGCKDSSLIKLARLHLLGK